MNVRSRSIAACCLAVFAVLGVLAISACAPSAAPAGTPPSAPAAPPEGIDLAGIDRSVAPGDDFFGYANGAWIKTTEIPADRSSWGVSGMLVELTARRTADLITEASKTEGPAGSDARKIGDTYATFMDEAAIEAKGLQPLQPALGSLAAISDARALARALGGTLRADVDVLNNTNFYTAQPVRPLGRAGPQRPRPLFALPPAGRPGNARPRLLPRRVAAHGGDPNALSGCTSPPS